MQNKITYDDMVWLCRNIPLHFDYDSVYGGRYYKAIINKANKKYILLCSILESRIEEENLYEELYELLYSNRLTFEYMHFNFYNLTIIKDGKEEIIYIKED